MTQISRISAKAIDDARSNVSPEFLDSRQVENDSLSATLGVRVLCKIECENAVGSFKGRGTDVFVRSLSSDCKHLVTGSAGNFGLALTYSAKRRGIATTVYAGETASAAKLDRMRSMGADVRVQGRDFDEAKACGRAMAAQLRVPFVEDGREPTIAIGAGTMAIEIARYPKPLDTVIVPLGNGALLAGLGHWFRARSPKTRIVGVCSEGAPSMALSWRNGKPESTERAMTIADGIAVRIPVPEAVQDIQNVVDDILLVKEDAIKHALGLVYSRLKLSCEPSGVVGIAALISHSSLAKGLVCTPITGSNATPEQLEGWITNRG